MPSGFQINNANLALLLIFGIPIIALVGHFCISALKLIIAAVTGQSLDSEGNSNSKTELGPEDIAMLQELHSGFEKMERRVDALETLLMDRFGKGGQCP